ncbi:MAG TPA: DNA-directed RNA polymerase subunit beta' [Dehalococcoidia bacterium]|nr:DNA-directed RNA polymerase subunit beta' [Dehalococcoidia bacterium]
MVLEVNDFNAVRISLASPEQIRSWSYGEVTKPETINYRTLKPEKDGLFCEKIFGPTKDFECYCGKYKRVRYKGIICDKCGVEVARSKVRRERMGHIELASPVSHIWFVKGTPSRLGLLLDISPRSLERVLYFAQYIITHVDEDMRTKVLDQIRRQIESETAERSRGAEEQTQAIRERVQATVDEAEQVRNADFEALDQERETRIAKLVEDGAILAARLQPLIGEASTEQVSVGESVLVVKDEAIKPDIEDRIREATQKLVDEAEEDIRNRREQATALFEATREQGWDAATKEIEPLQEKVRLDRDAVRTEFDEQIIELEREIQSLRLIPETKLRDWQERYPGVFTFGMGAEAILDILRGLDIEALRQLLQEEIHSASGQRRKKATKRLRVIETLRKSGNRPEWMIFTVLPVLPPDLRPMVQLDGGRFATSDLNDLYRRVINRNNRLKRLLELGAPEIIIRNEKRMLQEAVDSLIDNGRRGRAVAGSGNHKLKSLSDMLKGKQGRFRQNLLGKRVDYSGRSVIVVGPELKLHQCGLPKRMALELFKPFVMHALVDRQMAHNIKSAKRIVERARPEVWDVLDEVIKERPVLLNRAPTLHRLGIQAFEPVLIEGSAIQIHPLVCAAFNADFDGDQMAVHVPLSREAVAEARQVMLSTHNLLAPSNGEPTVAPTLDMVLGCYYLTLLRAEERGAYREANQAKSISGEGTYGSFAEAQLAYDLNIIGLHAPIRVKDSKTNNEFVETTAGRIIFNEDLPAEIPFKNEVMDKKALKNVVAECYTLLGNEITAEIVDRIKHTGFTYATRSGITIAMNDIKVPEEKAKLLEQADRGIDEIEGQYQMGLITDEERYTQTVSVWQDTTDRVTDAIQGSLDHYGSVYMMATSGAKGNIQQIRQMAGMRGLMSDPSGRIIALPIRSSFREGLSVLEYFISTHGARKGLADTALRTADSGYLTRRLIDVSQDVIIQDEMDCGTQMGIWLSEPTDKGVLESMKERIVGRYAAADVINEATGEIILERNAEITDELAEEIETAGIDRVYVRSPLTCETTRGLCRLCYGRSLARGVLVKPGEAVGIIAAQSIGEPGTQLTMRTFHTGGIAGSDITSGLPRVEELFEARVPKGQAIISEIDGVVELLREGESRRVRITSTDLYRDDYTVGSELELLVQQDQWVEQGTPLARARQAEGPESTEVVPSSDLVARMAGRVLMDRPGQLSLIYEEKDEREYVIPAASRLLVDNGTYLHAGDRITDGSKNPQDVLLIQGREPVQLYLVEEVQKVYRSQGVNINDKHIEVIVRQMLRKVRIDTPGDTEMLPAELVDRFQYEERNFRVLAEGGEPATAHTVLLGVTKASLSTDSFLAAASFQETTRVLTEAAITGQTDRLQGLKENVIIGKLIPARAELDLPPVERVPQLRQPIFGYVGTGDDGFEDEFESDADLLDEAELEDLEADDTEIDFAPRPLDEVESFPPGEPEDVDLEPSARPRALFGDGDGAPEAP